MKHWRLFTQLVVSEYIRWFTFVALIPSDFTSLQRYVCLEGNTEGRCILLGSRVHQSRAPSPYWFTIQTLQMCHAPHPPVNTYLGIQQQKPSSQPCSQQCCIPVLPSWCSCHLHYWPLAAQLQNGGFVGKRGCNCQEKEEQGPGK